MTMKKGSLGVCSRPSWKKLEQQVEIKAITLDGYIDTQDHYYMTRVSMTPVLNLKHVSFICRDKMFFLQDKTQIVLAKNFVLR